MFHAEDDSHEQGTQQSTFKPLIHRKGREERKGKALNKILAAFAKTACFRVKANFAADFRK
jgi:hypothetical protein